MTEYAIAAKQLSRSFRDFRAVDSVDLAVGKGEIFGFLGPNGAGKSTTVRMLTTLLLPTSGSATVAGFDIVRQPVQVRMRIGAALQEAALDAKQTGLELLRLQGRLYGLSGKVINQRIKELERVIDIGDALRRQSRKEKRFAAHVNHVISKQVVLKAERTNRAIALEDLQGIRSRVRVRKSQRRQHHAWAFYQLRQFIQYKAGLAGIPVVLVDPRNTSRTCPDCGYVDKANRVSQSRFSCVQCAFAGPADTVAAENIRRAAVNRPDLAAPLGPAKSPCL